MKTRYKKRKTKSPFGSKRKISIGKQVYKNYMNSSGSVVGKNVFPVVWLIVVIFLLKQYSNIKDWLKGLFKSSTHHYIGNEKELPQTPEYYKAFIQNIVADINGFSPLNTELYSLVTISPQELQYVTDHYYNSEHPTEGLVEACKSDTWDNIALRLLLSNAFSNAGIPF